MCIPIVRSLMALPRPADCLARLARALAAPAAAILFAACTEQAFAPQDASVEVRVAGRPADRVAQVTAFVRDTLPPYNMLTNPVPVGGAVRFDRLGAGFHLEVGVRDLGTHRCTLLDGRSNGFAIFDSTTIVETESGATEIVEFTVQCRSGAIAVTVAGLPPGDSARLTFASPFDTVSSHRFRNGTTSIRVVADAALSILSDVVYGSDGYAYDTPPQAVAVVSGQTTTVTLNYARAQNQAVIRVDATGVPDDPGITLTAFARRVAPPVTRDSAVIAFGGAHQFTNVAHGVAYDVGLEGLDVYACELTFASSAFVATAASVTVRLTTPATQSSPSFATFTLRCRTGDIDLVVSGLPPADSANVLLDAVFDNLSLRVRNGTTSVRIVPYRTRIDPQPVLASDGRVYDAPFQTVDVASRQRTTITVPYSATAACPADRPLAWYALNGNGADSTANAFHGYLQGATAIADRNGNAGAALSFDGYDDQIDVGDRFNTLALPYSVAAWLYQPLSARGEYRSIFASDDATGQYNGIWFMILPNGRLSMSYGSGGPSGESRRRTVDSNAAIPADTWVHVTATVRGPTDMTLYVNGAAVASTYSGTGGSLVHSAAPARIGTFQLIPGNRPWLGRMDELRIYDCSLDASEVVRLFNQQ